MRFTYRAAGPVAAVVILTLLAACSRAQRDWRVAQQADTAQSYRVFVTRHPDSELASVARERIAQLTDEAAWQQATRKNTAAAYRAYLTTYPHGSWSQDARIRMESKSLAALPPRDTSPTAAGPAEATAADDPPEVTKRAAAARSAPSDGLAAVQLGAFSSAANAQSAWQQLASKFGGELGGLTHQVVAVSLPGRRLYRLQARVADQAAARRLCRRLTQRSLDCLPLP